MKPFTTEDTELHRANPPRETHEPSIIDVAIATAAITAVSARKIVGPNEAARHPASPKAVNSSSFHPPSGPNANTTERECGGIASLSITSSSISDNTI